MDTLLKMEVRGEVTFEKYRNGKLIDFWKHHNLVVNEGDALIADCLCDTPARTKIDATNGYVYLGDSSTDPAKSDTAIVGSGIGNPHVLDTGYPALVGTFGNASDNVVEYICTFEAGWLIGTVSEAVLMNNSDPGSADVMARTTFTPKSMTSSDSLVVTWRITILGA